MAKMTEAQVARKWQSRLASADKLYDEWENTYRPDILEDYWKGEQRAGRAEDAYSINLCFPTVEIRLPSILFFRPVYKIQPREGRLDDGAGLEDRITLREGVLNTIVSDPDTKFTETMELVIREHFFRFGAVEVGFSADYIDNPNANKPMLDEDNKEISIPQPARLPMSEQVYVKRIPAKQFRVAANGGNDLDRADWCGYYEWVYPSDIKNNPNYKNADKLKGYGRLSLDTETHSPSDKGNDDHRDMVKLWKIWDNRTKRRYVYVDGQDFFLQRDKFTFLPLSMLSMHPVLDDPYPCPPCANWIDPQREYNETREMQRLHRKRYVRRYLVLEGQVEDELQEKLESPEDGVMIKVKRMDAIQALQDAPLDLSVTRNVSQTKEDFFQISGVGGEARSIADSNTATQANIIDQRSQVRESYARAKVGAFLVRVGWHILRTVEENATLPLWIAMNVDPTAEDDAKMAETKAIVEVWKQIRPQQLGDLAYEVTLDVSTLSPVNDEQERQNWTQALSILTNPSLLLALMSSDLLLRKTLSFYNIRSERDIAELKRVGQTILAGLQAQMQAKAGGPDKGAQGAGSGPTPAPADIQLQLARQAGVA